MMAVEIAEHIARIGISQKRLYTAAEAANYLGVSETTVRGLIRDGLLKEVDIVRSQLRLDVRDLDRLIEERKR